MKYFFIDHPYLALIKAKTWTDALNEYSESVGDIEDDTSHYMSEISRDRALLMFSRGLSEDGKQLLPISEVLTEFEGDESSTLLVDSALI